MDPCRLKPLRNLLSLQLHAREIRGSLPPALFRCLNRLQHLTISGAHAQAVALLLCAMLTLRSAGGLVALPAAAGPC